MSGKGWGQKKKHPLTPVRFLQERHAQEVRRNKELKEEVTAWEAPADPTSTPSKPPPPTLKNTTPLPSSLSPYPHLPFHNSSILWIYRSLRCHPETVGASNGRWGWKKKCKNDLKKEKINVSCPFFQKKNVFALFQIRRKKSNWQVTVVFVNTSFFVIYSMIQAAKVLIAVCHFYKFPLLAYIWMWYSVHFHVFLFISAWECFLFYFLVSLVW